MHAVNTRTDQVFILSNGCAIKYSKKNVKIYIIININVVLNFINQLMHFYRVYTMKY